VEKIKLVLPGKELELLPRLDNLRLNVNGKKPRRRNLYERQLNRIRRLLR